MLRALRRAAVMIASAFRLCQIQEADFVPAYRTDADRRAAVLGIVRSTLSDAAALVETSASPRDQRVHTLLRAALSALAVAAIYERGAE